MSKLGESHGYTPPAAMPEYLIRHTTLRQLQIFEATVRLGSFTRAAEELFLTQPTVSMQIKKLSDVMGIALFEHIGRKVKPTEAGSELYESCCKMFEVLANLEMTLSDIKGIKRGRLRIGVVSTAKYFTPEILGEFFELYPGIDVALKVSNRDRIAERINNDVDDLYIIGQKPDSVVDIDSYYLAPNPLVIMAPRNHPFVGRKNIPLEELAEEPFIFREPGSGIRDAAIRAFEERGIKPKLRMELGSNEAIKHAIVGGLGLSVLSLHTLTLEGPGGPVALLDVEGFPIMRQWHLVHPKGKELSLVSKAFLDFALDLAPGMQNRLETIWPQISDSFKKK